MHDAIILSDLHLGSAVCRADALRSFLESIHAGELTAERLILNGDVFDGYDLRRLRPSHWEVLAMIRDLSLRMDVVWLCGNHDGPADRASQILGTPVETEYVFRSGTDRVMVLHGDLFDDFIAAHPRFTHVADWFYRGLQRVDPTHVLARIAKHRSKVFLRATGKIAASAIEYAEANGCDVVCCGHTHFPVSREARGVRYYNSGCWTETPCHYLTVLDGEVRTHAVEPTRKVEVTVPTASEEPATAAV